MWLAAGDLVVFINIVDYKNCSRLRPFGIYRIVIPGAELVCLKGCGNWAFRIDRFELVDPAKLSKVEKIVYEV